MEQQPIERKTYGRIYLLTNVLDGMRYVGRTKQSLKDRIRGHLRKNDCRYIYNALTKHGFENFRLEELAVAYDKAELIRLEGEFVERLNTLSPNGYNLIKPGDKVEPSEETRQLLSDAMVKRFADPAALERLSKDVKKVRSTPESKVRTSLASKAAWMNSDTRAKRERSRKEFWQKPEAHEAASKLMLERCKDPEYVSRMTAAVIAYRSTPAAREAHSELMKASWADPSFREKMTASLQELADDPKRAAERSAKITAALHKRYEDPTQRRKKSEGSHAMWGQRTEEERQAIGAAISATKSTPEARARTAEQMRNRMADKEKVKASAAKASRTRRERNLLTRQIALLDWSPNRVIPTQQVA